MNVTSTRSPRTMGWTRKPVADWAATGTRPASSARTAKTMETVIRRVAERQNVNLWVVCPIRQSIRGCGNVARKRNRVACPADTPQRCEGGSLLRCMIGPAPPGLPDLHSCYRQRGPFPLRKLRLPIVVLAIALGSAHEASAQTLTLSLFERYLDALRVQAGIPAVSGAVLQNGVVVWEKGFGRPDVTVATPATADTPYAIAGMSQALSSTLLLRKCVDQSYLSTRDPVQL